MIVARDRSARRKRRWFRFRLRTLLVAVTLLCLWLGLHVHRAYEQKRAVAALEEMGALVYYRPVAVWLATCLERDLISRPTAVSFFATGIDDADLAHLRSLSALRIVNVAETNVSDGGIPHLLSLPHLEELYHDPDQFSQAGLEKLKGFSRGCYEVQTELEGWIRWMPADRAEHLGKAPRAAR